MSSPIESSCLPAIVPRHLDEMLVATSRRKFGILGTLGILGILGILGVLGVLEILGILGLVGLPTRDLLAPFYKEPGTWDVASCLRRQPGPGHTSYYVGRGFPLQISVK